VGALCAPFRAMAANPAATHLSALDEVGLRWTELSTDFDAADNEVTFWERALFAADSQKGRNELEQAKLRRDRSRRSMVQFLDRLDLS